MAKKRAVLPMMMMMMKSNKISNSVLSEGKHMA
jgi:hypothetical protein